MDKHFSILFAYRDRDTLRIRNSMLSLQEQTDKKFEVVFVDYGSKEENADAVKQVLSEFSFVNYHYVAHPGLLWNKSKAFNYGIRKSKYDYIITADIDLIFHTEFIQNMTKLAFQDSFTVFSYAYLPQSLSIEHISNKKFNDLIPTHTGAITGSGIYPKKALENIHGFDEFYHFYGSEDEDLFIRLESYGLEKRKEAFTMLAHQWHSRYTSDENKLSKIPKLSNVRRINMVQSAIAKNSGLKIPIGQQEWGKCFGPADLKSLSIPQHSFKIDCREAQISHFLNERLKYLKGIVHAEFSTPSQKKSIKSQVKQLIGKRPEPLLSLKEVNDRILKTIIYRYRNHNYLFHVNDLENSICFKIDLTDE